MGEIPIRETEAPSDLIEAAKLLAQATQRKVYILKKRRGGLLYNKRQRDFWCLAFETDAYDNEGVINEDGSFGIVGRLT